MDKGTLSLGVSGFLVSSVVIGDIPLGLNLRAPKGSFRNEKKTTAKFLDLQGSERRLGDRTKAAREGCCVLLVCSIRIHDPCK